MHRILPLLAAASAALAISPATGSAALPKTCVKGGVCFSKTFSGPRIKLIVTGTAGDDVLTGGDRADTMLGGLGTDTATRDPLDTVSGVEILR